MLVTLLVVFVASRAGGGAQGQQQALSAAPVAVPVPPSQPPFPFLDLFTGASSYYPERKIYSDPTHHTISCPKTDTLGSFANILGSAAKIMMSAAAIVFLKFLAGKLLLFPITAMLFFKIGLKAILLWPMVSKMIKYFKKKKKKHDKGRSIMDCSERIACVIQESSRDGWGNLGAAATFSLINDVEEDSSFAKILLTILSGDKVARCMSVECTSGVDVS